MVAYRMAFVFLRFVVSFLRHDDNIDVDVDFDVVDDINISETRITSQNDTFGLRIKSFIENPDDSGCSGEFELSPFQNCSLVDF